MFWYSVRLEFCCAHKLLSNSLKKMKKLKNEYFFKGTIWNESYIYAISVLKNVCAVAPSHQKKKDNFDHFDGGITRVWLSNRKRQKIAYQIFYFFYFINALGQLLLSLCVSFCSLHQIWYAIWNVSWIQYDQRERMACGIMFVERKIGPRVPLLHLQYICIHIFGCVRARKYIEAHARNIHIWFATHIYYFIVIIIIISILYVW